MQTLLSYLVDVVVSVEERLLAENHAGQNAAEAPDVKGVVIVLESGIGKNCK